MDCRSSQENCTAKAQNNTLDSLFDNANANMGNMKRMESNFLTSMNGVKRCQISQFTVIK